MKQAENLLKCKALLMKITKTASFSFLVPFGFPRMLLIVLLSISKRDAIVISLEPERIANRRSKEDIKRSILRFIASISEKLSSLVHFKNVSFGIAN